MKLVKFLFRIDNFNRMIVLISMALFLFPPSWLLYHADQETLLFDLVMPCVVMIGMVVGNGALTFYRPLRCTFLYFINMLLTFICTYRNFNYEIIDKQINMTAIYWISIVYCIVGITYNVFYFAFYLLRRNKRTSEEATNNDTAYDFLGGNKANSEVLYSLLNMKNKDNNQKKNNGYKRTKFSKILRIVSLVFCLVSYFYLILNNIRKGNPSNSQFMIISVLSILILSITFFASLVFPKDFKYIYYFNAFFLLSVGVIACKDIDLQSIPLIICAVFTAASFIVTLITEGRTWMGAPSD